MKHAEADEIGISALLVTDASELPRPDKSDIGEKCEKDDVEAIQTGKPFVEKEKDGFDVSLPLHDSTGKLIGVVESGLRRRPVRRKRVLLGRGLMACGRSQIRRGDTMRALAWRCDDLHFISQAVFGEMSDRRFRLTGRRLKNPIPTTPMSFPVESCQAEGKHRSRLFFFHKWLPRLHCLDIVLLAFSPMSLLSVEAIPMHP